MKTTSAKLDALRKREQELKTAIAQEKVRQQKRREKDDARVFSIIGVALVKNTTLHSDFDLMLRGILKTTSSFSEGERNLLRAKGWL